MISLLFILIISIGSFADFTPADQATDCAQDLANNTMMAVAKRITVEQNGATHIREQEKFSMAGAQARGIPYAPMCADYLPATTLSQGCTSFVYQQRYIVTNFHCLQGPLFMSNLDFYSLSYIDVQRACENIRFLHSSSPTAGSTARTDTYDCKRVVAYSMSSGTQRQNLDNLISYGVDVPLMPDDTNGNKDFIIMELDRPFTGPGVSVSHSPPSVGQPIVHVGYPHGSGRMLSRGQITKQNDNIYYSADTLPGNSAGPVALPNCQVVALHQGRNNGDPNIAPFEFSQSDNCFRRNPQYQGEGQGIPISMVVDAFNRAINPQPDSEVEVSPLANN